MQRVVLGRKAPETMVGFQWSGNEPEGMFDIDFAIHLGAQWEGDELVTYNLEMLQHNWGHHRDGYLEDSD